MILAIGGRLGLEIGPYTLRELLVMDEAASIDRWNHTANLLAQMANAIPRGKGPRKIYGPLDFHPHRQKLKRLARRHATMKIDFATFLKHWTGPRGEG